MQGGTHKIAAVEATVAKKAGGPKQQRELSCQFLVVWLAFCSTVRDTNSDRMNVQTHL